MFAIRAYLRRHGMTLTQLAEKVGDVTPTSLSRIDRGEQEPGARLLKRIAAATDGELTPNLVLGFENPDGAPKEAGAPA